MRLSRTFMLLYMLDLGRQGSRRVITETPLP